MKTYEQWDGSGQHFNEFFSPGETVDDDTVNYMGTTVPPASASPGYLQNGEPYSHRANEKTGQFAPTYYTFSRQNSRWTYCGTCFLGETEHQQ